VEFFGADQADKVRGPRRDILFINEGNNVPWETAQGLDIRTSTFTIVDWNPTGQFWAHEQWLDKEGTHYVHSTYLDALDVLPSQVVTDIESYRDSDPNWWNIYGLGLIGKVEGLVYPFFEQIDKLPDGGEEFYGLDFGYLRDPSALIRCKALGWNLYCEELFYEPLLDNDQIASKFDQLGIRKSFDEIWADPDEPKSIEEIHQRGFNIKPAQRVRGIEEWGHQRVRQYRQYWTKSSVNCIKEQRNFRYIKDKDGHLTDKTTHQWSHGMRARAYGVTGKDSEPSFDMPVKQRYR
jgi:phage terminase large subunit